MKRVALLMCLVLTACSGQDRPDDPATAATAAPSPAASPACPNQAAAVADVSLQTGDSASGDVDGDGTPETVAVHLDPAGDAGCRAFLVATGAGDDLAGPLGTWRPDLGLPAPSIVSLRAVDARPGLEVVVRMGAGASTEFVAIVTVVDGTFVHVTTDVPQEVAEGLFGVGGSVGHVEAVDCAPGGGVVASFAAPAGDDYRVERRFLTFEGAALVEEDVRVERVPLEEIDRFPEYRTSPFGSCRG